ncbi:MAG: hypothetical protein JW862_07235 [Anaerolineales bacterium]|nr:hypothetical protein [Anaerolineales bacterium]
MNQVLRIKQAYSQTPWRKQVQGIGMFLSLLILGSLVAIVYLSVSSQTAAIGRQIQSDQYKIAELDLIIASKQSKLAFLTSADEMERRAVALGFQPVAPGQVSYLVIEGYRAPVPPQLAPDVQPNIAQVELVSPAFTESLLDWIREQIYLPPMTLGSVQP